ncbi:MAG: hypothetical protein HC898_07615 [Phycisphaerales bacterium]|nr:hypothetical protein [Phycisphaerales bacterium]
MEETIAAWLVSDFMGKNEQEDREDDDELLKELADLEDMNEDPQSPATDDISNQSSAAGRSSLDDDEPAKSSNTALNTAAPPKVARASSPVSDAPASTPSRASSPIAPSISSATHQVAAGTLPDIAPATASAATPAPHTTAPLPSFYSTQPKVPGNQANALTPSTEPVNKPLETLSAASTTAMPTVPDSPAVGDASGLTIPAPEVAQSASAESTTPAVPIPTVVITMPPDPRKSCPPG